MDQLIDKLAYRLVPGPVALEPLQTLASRRIDWCGWSVTFHVLGASHAVSLERGGERLTELLTCIPPPDDPASLLHLSDAPCSGCASYGGLICRVQLATMDLDSFRGLPREADSLEHEFPEHGGVSPMTRIEWHAAENTLEVKTIHTYPECGRAITSRTILSARRSD